MRVDRKGWLPALIIFTACTWLSGCVAKYPVVAKFVNSSEVFRGSLTARSHPEKGSIEIKGQVNEVKCVGRSMMNFAPPGKEGRLALACQDGKRILTHYQVIAWGKGYGNGIDQDGIRFVFTFGMPDDEARKYLREGEP